MKQTRIIATAALLAAALSSGSIRAEVLLREEFDGYGPGSIHGQEALGTGLTGTWDYFRGNGTANIGPGLSGENALVIDAEGGDNDVQIGHTVPDWGTGQIWMSYLYNEVSYGGHAYVTGGGSFAGAFGHAWSSNFGINNESGPGNVPYVTNQTYRLVALIDWDAGTTSLWIDPDPDADPTSPDFPAADVVKAEAQSATPNLRLGYYNTDCTVDDIIMGTEYADVAIAVPGDPPVAPGPVMPTDAATGVLLDTVLQWTPNGSTSYDVFLWKDGEAKPDPATAIVDVANYDPAGLDPLTTYHWQIDSFNDNGSTTGAEWTFTTSDGVVPVVPVDGVTDVPLDVPIQWADNGASSWEIYLWMEGETKPATATGTVTSPSYAASSLTPSTTYLWEVVSLHAEGDPTTSSTWSFTTGSGVSGELLLHEEFDGYAPGSIVGQTGNGSGLTGVWTQPDANGAWQLGLGLSGDNGLVITNSGGGSTNVTVDHTIEEWGSGQLWMSFLYNETVYAGHFYVSGGGGFNGGAGHMWSNGTFGLHNQNNPGFPYVQGETYRLVVLWDWDAGNTTLWVDPEFHPLAYGLTPAAQKTELPDATQALMMTSWCNGTVDDIRIGTDFASVTDVLPTDSIELSIVRAGSNLVFRWNSESGQVYDLVASASLDSDPAGWVPVAGASEIPAGPDGMTEWTIPLPPEAMTFYAVRGYDPPPLLEESFEDNDGGFTYVDYSDGTGTPWELGTPDSDSGFFSVVTEGNGGSLKCWATNLGDVAGTGDAGFYNDTTDAALSSPVIDLTTVTSGTLSFAHAMDVITGDTAVVNFLDVDNGDTIVASEPFTDPDGGSSEWITASLAIPAEALGKNIRIEWRLSTSVTTDYIGWYIDDVRVDAN